MLAFMPAIQCPICGGEGRACGHCLYGSGTGWSGERASWNSVYAVVLIASSYVEHDPGEFFKNQSHSGAVDWKIGWGYSVDHGGAARNVVWPTVHDSDRGMYLRIVAIFGHFRCFLAIFTSNVALENALEPASQWRCGLVNWSGIQCRPWRCCTQRGLAYSSRV